MLRLGGHVQKGIISRHTVKKGKVHFSFQVGNARSILLRSMGTFREDLSTHDRFLGRAEELTGIWFRETPDFLGLSYLRSMPPANRHL
jgi:hypothetical protein